MRRYYASSDLIYWWIRFTRGTDHLLGVKQVKLEKRETKKRSIFFFFFSLFDRIGCIYVLNEKLNLNKRRSISSCPIKTNRIEGAFHFPHSIEVTAKKKKNTRKTKRFALQPFGIRSFHIHTSENWPVLLLPKIKLTEHLDFTGI